jgi:hypothetical protein
VNTCPAALGFAVRSRRCAATLSSVIPSQPISSSIVGSVVGSWGQRISSAFHTGRCGCVPRPSEQYSKPIRCVSLSACTFICHPAAPWTSGGALKMSV